MLTPAPTGLLVQKYSQNNTCKVRNIKIAIKKRRLKTTNIIVFKTNKKNKKSVEALIIDFLGSIPRREANSQTRGEKKRFKWKNDYWVIKAHRGSKLQWEMHGYCHYQHSCAFLCILHVRQISYHARKFGHGRTREGQTKRYIEATLIIEITK